MAYSKQTWTNDVTAITAERMTHIENGIYDNSLATDKINPSGTATTTAEIEAGQITDVIGFKSLNLKGQTSQYTTTGKNIFPRITFSQTISGVTITATGDGTIKIKGTANSSGVNHPIWGAWGSSTTLFTIPAGTYTASGIGTRQSSPRMNIVTNGTTSIFVTNTTQTLDSDTNVTGIFIWVDAGTTVDTTFKPMIETGSSATSYEPYTGKKASPNPDFPQDVNNVSGYNVVEISNKNLLKTKLPTTTQSGVTLTNNGDGTYTLNGTNSSSGTITFRINQSDGVASNLQDYEDGAYTLDLGVAIPNVQMCLTQNTTYTNFLVTGYGVRLKSETLSNATNTFIYIAIRTGTTINNVTIRPMLVKGTYTTSTMPSFVAHQGNEFEVNLGKNLIEDETFVQGTFNNSTGTNRISCRNIKLKANTTYTFSSNLNYSTYNVAIVTSTNQFPIQSSETPKYDSGWKTANFSFTTGNDDVYANIAVKKVGELVIAPSDVSAYHFQIEKGDTATQYEKHFTPIEICKINTYQDYIYKKDGKWFKHKAIEKIILNGTESWVLDGALTNTNRFRLGITSYNIRNIAVAGAGFSNQLQIVNAYSDESEHLYTYKPSSIMNLYVFYTKTRCADLAGLQTWLSANNLIIYGILNTPIDEEITYAPLLRQLDELYNSGLYDVTNISQDNSSEAFILDMEACKNNINGIVEYIRR